MLSYVFKSFLLAEQRKFFHRSKHYNILFPQLEDNIAYDFLDHHHHHLQITKQKVYLLIEKLDELENLKICFVLELLF